MTVRTRRRIALVPAVVAMVALGVFAAKSAAPAAQAQQQRTRSEFMRQKLEFSKNLLEGLSMENYETIGKNAKALKLLSQAAEWEVPTIPNATDYVAFTTDFQRIADDLAKQAKDKNIDGATIAYLKLTMNCVQCHKFVRFASH
jgi:hypothetical protein